MKAYSKRVHEYKCISHLKKGKEKDPLRPPLMARRSIAFTCSSEAQEYRERWRARCHGGRGYRLLEEVGQLAGALHEPSVLQVLLVTACQRRRLQQRLRPLRWRRGAAAYSAKGGRAERG